MYIQIENGHKSSGILHDFCDREAFTLFSKSRCFTNIFYFDELELGNPLGSKVKIHKLGIIKCTYTCWFLLSTIQSEVKFHIIIEYMYV